MPREFGARDGLVGAFSAGGEGEGGGGEGFARGWVVGDAGDEVDVEGAEDCEGWDWGGHFGRLVVVLGWVGLVLWWEVGGGDVGDVEEAGEGQEKNLSAGFACALYHDDEIKLWVKWFGRDGKSER